MADATWLVGRTDELGELQTRLEAIDATVQETWPAGENAEVVALVRSAPDDVDVAAVALRGAERFDDESAAQRRAAELVQAD